MPRRRQRFSRLDALYRAVRGNIPADNPELANYIEWRKGNRKITVNQKLTTAERKRYAFGILPFNIELAAAPTPTDRYAAPITAYSNTGRKSAAVALSDADLGYENVDPNTNHVSGFYPAILHIFVKDNATSPPVDKISDITGEPYKRHAGKSFTVPFGRTVSGDKDGNVTSSGEDDIKNALIADLKSKTAVGGVSYEPELFRSGNILSSPT